MYQVVLPIVILVVSGYVIPLIRNSAKVQKNNLKKQGLNSLADILNALTKIAEVQVTQTEANKSVGATGVDKKQAAVQATKIQAQNLGLDTKHVDVPAIVEAAFSTKKQELHANYNQDSVAKNASAANTTRNGA
ncbi:hypothetical protein FC83_GL002720 [Agrilactobacillus composti DSM 18527 = JCM 14202]|uniref:Phage holin, LL-H family n=1 Tax=Agrilactobacillus composti DSM 18527 = JCM 14202 TaxID=1423734 RepID=X0PW45_9LACO|nr:hypothetical protein FC83_GL002720 [Agrilactobacillus composti DSM 18527 = JCM 14202]GAF41786.1 hypothetical protein JCM14202_3745 [Agrilactobacillus composti DSM 18527 = JCM 14202]